MGRYGARYNNRYTYIQPCTHIYMGMSHMCLCVCMYMCIYVCPLVYVYMRVCTSAYGCVRILYVRVSAPMCAYVYVLTCAFAPDPRLLK